MFSSFSSKNRSTIIPIAPAELDTLPPNIRMIDVREPHEYQEDHLPKAELVPLGTLSQVARDWDKSGSYLMICRSGGRSGRGAAELVALGFQNVMNLSGGMSAVRSRGT